MVLGLTAGRFVVWAMAMQCVGFGTVMPIFAIWHLTGTARLSSTSKHTFGTGLKTLPRAVILGFLLPSVLVVLPVSPVLHQQFVALWQFFPIWISTIMFIHKSFINRPTTSETRSQLASIYQFSELLALWTHRITMVTLLLIKVRPAYFPLFLVESLTFSNVFLPPLPYSTAQVSMLGGAEAFFKYDLFSGFLAAIIWQFSVSPIYLHVDLVLDVLMKGPGYTFTRITEIRDQLLFEIVQADEEKAIKEEFSSLGFNEEFVKATKEIRDNGAINRKGKLNSY